MGIKSDVELAQHLADQAEAEARRAEGVASPPEWRWSRTGWGEWGAPEPAPSAAIEPETDTPDKD